MKHVSPIDWLSPFSDHAGSIFETDIDFQDSLLPKKKAYFTEVPITLPSTCSSSCFHFYSSSSPPPPLILSLSLLLLLLLPLPPPPPPPPSPSSSHCLPLPPPPPPPPLPLPPPPPPPPPPLLLLSSSSSSSSSPPPPTSSFSSSTGYEIKREREDDRIYRIFQDVTAQHLLICMENKECYYLGRAKPGRRAQLRPLPKVSSIHVECVKRVGFSSSTVNCFEKHQCLKGSCFGVFVALLLSLPLLLSSSLPSFPSSPPSFLFLSSFSPLLSSFCPLHLPPSL